MALKVVSPIAKVPRRIDVPVAGWTAGYEPEQGLLVDFAGNPGPPVLARSAQPLTAAQAREASASRRSVLLIFEDGDTQRPILVGLVRETTGLPEQPNVVNEAPQASPPIEAVVDGRRVVLSGKEEIQLRCGKASITLRSNGAVVIKGAQLISHASGTNRIRGGSVQIN